RSPLPPSPFPYTTLFRSGGYAGLTVFFNLNIYAAPFQGGLGASPESVHSELGAEHSDISVTGMNREAAPAVPLQVGNIKVGLPLDRKSTRLNSSHVSISY